jgi:hypothetical protein
MAPPRGQKLLFRMAAEVLAIPCENIRYYLPPLTDAFQVCYNRPNEWETTMRDKGSIIASMLLGVALFAPSNVEAVPLSCGKAAIRQPSTTQQVRCRSSRRNRCYRVISRPEQTTRHFNEYYPRSGWNGM